MAIVGPGLHLISYIVFAVHPPYPVLVIFFMLVGFGNGILDAAWCAWLGNMANANHVTGFLQASYALGATVSPLIATALITKAGLGWYTFYYLMVFPLSSIRDEADKSRLVARSLSWSAQLGHSGPRQVRFTSSRTPVIQIPAQVERDRHSRTSLPGFSPSSCSAIWVQKVRTPLPHPPSYSDNFY